MLTQLSLLFHLCTSDNRHESFTGSSYEHSYQVWLQWASSITERRRLNTDNKLFDSYGSLLSFGYFRSTTKYKRIINLLLQFHSISVYTRKSIKQTYINISITLYRFGGTLMYFTKDMVCGLCNCGMVIKLKMKK